MHMGNARGGAIGDGLAAALDWAGFRCTRAFLINDAGNQIEKFAKSLEARYLQHFQGEEAVSFPEDGYHGADITAHAEHMSLIHISNRVWKRSCRLSRNFSRSAARCSPFMTRTGSRMVFAGSK